MENVGNEIDFYSQANKISSDSNNNNAFSKNTKNQPQSLQLSNEQ